MLITTNMLVVACLLSFAMGAAIVWIVMDYCFGRALKAMNDVLKAFDEESEDKPC